MVNILICFNQQTLLEPHSNSNPTFVFFGIYFDFLLSTGIYKFGKFQIMIGETTWTTAQIVSREGHFNSIVNVEPLWVMAHFFSL